MIGVVDRPGREPQDFPFEIGKNRQARVGHRSLRETSEPNKPDGLILANLSLMDKAYWR
jgi:hypothetical protein